MERQMRQKSANANGNKIVSESSFDVAVGLEYDFDLPNEYEFVYHDFGIDLVFEYDFASMVQLRRPGGA